MTPFIDWLAEARLVRPAGYACETGRGILAARARIAALEAEVARLTALLAPPAVTKPGIPALALSGRTMRVGLRT